jgi:hypothetical protein
LKSFSLKASLKDPAALAARVGMVHYIDTLVTHAHEEIYSQPPFSLSYT